MYKVFLFSILVVLIATPFIAAEDHSELIEGPYDTPQEVTSECLMCHEDVGEDVLKTRHWNWLGDEFNMEGHGTVQFGKQNAINNFCVAIPSNWPRCTSCHIGYGWKDETFDFNDPENIDCLVCHDQTGTYKKTPTGAGMPAEGVDLVAVAQSVGSPTRQNCGAACHFEGGGGNGVKHGDLDESLLNPSRELDVHMSAEGNDFSCTDCHAADNHMIAGASHGSMAEGANRILCIDCHDPKPHEKERLNDHTATVSCEACHIPTFAREMPTKTWWDWSTAGRDDMKETTDQYGKHTYAKKKGTFKWEKNVVPTYVWYDGKADYYQIGDQINPEKVVKLNDPQGSLSDADAKIYPFKVMKGKQPYDTGNNMIIVPKLFGKDGFWKTWDWNQANKLGMESVDLTYSGSYDFVETELYVPIHHMVAPVEDALNCSSCHHKKHGVIDWEALGYEGDPMSRRIKSRRDQGIVE